MRGNATRAQLAVSPEAGTQLAADQRGDRSQEAGWDLFVLAEHRCTGQPAPPGKAPEGRTAAESTERVTGIAIGLSGA